MNTYDPKKAGRPDPLVFMRFDITEPHERIFVPRLASETIGDIDPRKRVDVYSVISLDPSIFLESVDALYSPIVTALTGYRRSKRLPHPRLSAHITTNLSDTLERDAINEVIQLMQDSAHPVYLPGAECARGRFSIARYYGITEDELASLVEKPFRELASSQVYVGRQGLRLEQ